MSYPEKTVKEKKDNIRGDVIARQEKKTSGAGGAAKRTKLGKVEKKGVKRTFPQSR